MGWKDLPYWLKGGIIAVSINLLVAIFTSSSRSEMNGIVYAWSLAPLYYFKFFRSQYPNLISLTGAIMYFLIGALIGWIYGKIKNRKDK